MHKHYASWERDLNEHTNGLAREYLPKKTEFIGIEYDEILAIQKWHDSLVLKIKEAGYFIADKEYDSELIRKQAKELGMGSVIPKRSNTQKSAIYFEKHIDQSRHLMENLLARLKYFRRISIRFYKLSRYFKAMIYIACAIIWMNSK